MKLKSILLTLSLLAALAGARPLRAAVTWYSFTGNGANGNWSNPTNWSTGVPPASSPNVGINITSSANNKTSLVDIAGLVIEQVAMSGTNHTINAASPRVVVVNGQGEDFPAFQQSGGPAARLLRFGSNVELVLSNTCAVRFSTPYYLADGYRFEFLGRLSGPGSLLIDGHGTCLLGGPQANTFAGGVTVQGPSTLLLDKTAGAAVPGALTINIEVDSYGSYYPGRVTLLRSHQVADNAVVTCSGWLDLNNRDDVIGPLTLGWAARVMTGTGLLTLNGDVTSGEPHNGQPYEDHPWHTTRISGRLNLGTPADSRVGRQFNVVYACTLDVPATVSGSALLRLSGGGELLLGASNTLSGRVVVEDSVVTVGHSNALGTTNQNTWLGPGGWLALSNGVTLMEPLQLAGITNYEAGVTVTDGEAFLDGAIQITEAATFDLYPNATLHIRSPISGAGAVSFLGYGTTNIFEGSAINTYSGETLIADYSTLVLARGGTDAAIPGNLRIGRNSGNIPGTVRLLAANQIHNAAEVLLGPAGLLDLNGRTETVEAISGSGSITVGTGALTFGGLNRDMDYSGTITSAVGASLYKVGTGAFRLTGTNSLAGNTLVQGGTMIVDGVYGGGAIMVNNGSWLSGSGKAGRISGNGGTISPGNSPGLLASSNVTWTAGHTFRCEINGTTPGVNCDQLAVNGTVTLGGATLTPLLGFAGAVSNQYTLIANDGTDPVLGTFAGLPEGALFASSGMLFRINYAGGTGNDVVLTQLGPVPAPQLGSITRLGNGQIQLGGTGVPGLTYTVLANADLNTTNWVNLGTLTADGGGLLQFLDADAPFFPMRFYRLVIP